jgi:hypothetical protein
MDRLRRSSRQSAGNGPLWIDVMQKYNDGNFAAANQRLNQLAALLK